MSSVFMNLSLSIPGFSNDYNDEINNNFVLIDEHDHDGLNSKKLNENSIVFDNLNMGGNAFLNVGNLSFNNNPINPLKSIYFQNKDLYYKNSTGDIQISKNGAVNSSLVSGAIKGNFKQFDASLSYNLELNNYNLVAHRGDFAFTGIKAKSFEIENLTANQISIDTQANLNINSTSFYFDSNSILTATGFNSTAINQSEDICFYPRKRLISTADDFNNNFDTILGLRKAYQLKIDDSSDISINDIPPLTTSQSITVTTSRGVISNIKKLDKIVCGQVPLYPLDRSVSTVEPLQNFGAVIEFTLNGGVDFTVKFTKSKSSVYDYNTEERCFTVALIDTSLLFSFNEYQRFYINELDELEYTLHVKYQIAINKPYTFRVRI